MVHEAAGANAVDAQYNAMAVTTFRHAAPYPAFLLGRGRGLSTRTGGC